MTSQCQESLPRTITFISLTSFSTDMFECRLNSQVTPFLELGDKLTLDSEGASDIRWIHHESNLRFIRAHNLKDGQAYTYAGALNFRVPGEGTHIGFEVCIEEAIERPVRGLSQEYFVVSGNLWAKLNGLYEEWLRKYKIQHRLL